MIGYAKRRTYTLFVIVCMVAFAATARAADQPRLAIGEFYATRIAAPTIDGKVSPGEWDGALTTSGMMTPFGHELHEAATTMSLGFDDRDFYFLLVCRRGNNEWRLTKSVRENDGYSFGDPSIEIWVSPPTLVPETYQNIINTYPAVLDQKMIPTRGYTAQGWKGQWTVGVTESAEQYIIEASIPIKDFGFDTVSNGDVWRFLLCRTSPGTKPRAQASWAITQGFAEIASHPQVHLMDDSTVLQLLDVMSIFTGKYDFPMAVVAPKRRGAEIDVELRFHRDVLLGKDDLIRTQYFVLKPGERRPFHFTGDVSAWKRGFFTITATEKGGSVIFRQNFPFVVNGFVPKTPQRPEWAKIEELDLWPMYGPVTNTLLVRADVIDMPARKSAVSGAVRVLDAATGDVLKAQRLGKFSNWYASAHFKLDGVKVPVFDPAKNYFPPPPPRKGKKPATPWVPPAGKTLVTPRKVRVEVSATDAAGRVLKTSAKELDLVRYRFEWEDNDVGITDKVIPPWTPVTCRGGKVDVWNREMDLDGLGMLRGIRNGAAQQISKMRLVAVRDGREIEIKASDPVVKKHVDAWADLTGTGTGAGLKLTAKTHVEFDGFVLIDLTVAPAAAGKVDRLYLEIELPESEATHYCTTAGGWAAVHDVTPAYWNSLMTASGMLVRDFVPYVWLTNSDRAFLWFADTDKGWITGTDKKTPTMEMWRRNGKVTLQVKFIEIPTELKAPTTLQFGYQTFPSRPLPPGWRSIICANTTASLPSARNTYFWFEADWAVLWPYYCSPYPWNMDKSRKAFDRYPKDTTHRPAVGSIAHSIGRYRDYDGNQFDAFAVDWGETPGDRGNANITNCKGVNDFRLWHYRRWVREAGFRCLYVDENYLGLESNFLTGNAWHLPDGRLQRAYSYIGLRDYFKRLRIMFYQNGVPTPDLWQHISSGAAYNAWFGNMFFEGENVEPMDLKWDYIEVLPAGRMRAIGSSACAGGVMTMMCQSLRHRTIYEAKHTHQFVGWVMAHDIVPEQVTLYNLIAQEARFYRADVKFLPYWKKDTPVRVDVPGCLASAHAVPGRAIVWIVNTTRADKTLPVKVDFKGLALDPARTVAIDAETGRQVTLAPDGFSVPVLQRDFVAVHLIQRDRMSGAESLYASFDTTTDADESYGNCVFIPQRSRNPEPLRLIDGFKGKALALDRGIALWPHLEVSNAQGRIQFRLLLAGDARGTVLSAGPLSIQLTTGKNAAVTLNKVTATVTTDEKGRKRVNRKTDTETGPHPGAGWHVFDLSWSNGQATLTVDDKPVGSLPIDGLGFAEGTGHALEKWSTVTLGDSRNRGVTALDELKCFNRAE